MTITDDKKEETQILINIESNFKERGDGDEDQEELERITHNLRDELTEIDIIEKIDLVSKQEEAPKGSKAGAEVIALGSLLVTLGTSAVSTAIPSLSNALQSWLTRHERRKISLEIGGDKIEVTGVSDEQQQRLIESWISRHNSSKEQKKGSTTDGG